MNVIRRCPNCLKVVRFNNLLEIVKCPYCRTIFHPEQARNV